APTGFVIRSPRHAARHPDGSLRVHARRLPGHGHHPPRLPPAAHAADVADERHLVGGCHRCAHRDGTVGRHTDDGPRCRRGIRLDDERGERLHDHRPHAADVQASRGPAVMTSTAPVTELLYLGAAALFIMALRWMSQPATARRSVPAAVTGMLLAVVGTLIRPEVVTYQWIVVAAIAGTLLGIPLARVPLTAVPERTGLSQA